MRTRIDLLCFAFSALASYLYVVLFSDDVLLRSVIAFGQAHFLISYIYRIKSGRMDRPYATKFLLYTVLLGIPLTYVYSHTEWFPVVIFATFTIFVLHYFFDELQISNINMKNAVFGGFAAFFAFSAVFSRMLFTAHAPVLYTLSVLAAICSILFVYFLFSEDGDLLQQVKMLLFFGLNVGVPLYFALMRGADVYQISAFIIMFHYIRWYLVYFVRLYGTPELRVYLDFVLWVHIFVMLTFFEYAMSPNALFLYAFYSPLFFYGWTLVHIFLSVRAKDYAVTV